MKLDKPWSYGGRTMMTLFWVPHCSNFVYLRTWFTHVWNRPETKQKKWNESQNRAISVFTKVIYHFMVTCVCWLNSQNKQTQGLIFHSSEPKKDQKRKCLSTSSSSQQTQKDKRNLSENRYCLLLEKNFFESTDFPNEAFSKAINKNHLITTFLENMKICHRKQKTKVGSPSNRVLRLHFFLYNSAIMNQISYWSQKSSNILFGPSHKHRKHHDS